MNIATYTLSIPIQNPSCDKQNEDTATCKAWQNCMDAASSYLPRISEVNEEYEEMTLPYLTQTWSEFCDSDKEVAL